MKNKNTKGAFGKSSTTRKIQAITGITDEGMAEVIRLADKIVENRDSEGVAHIRWLGPKMWDITDTSATSFACKADWQDGKTETNTFEFIPATKKWKFINSYFPAGRVLDREFLVYDHELPTNIVEKMIAVENSI